MAYFSGEPLNLPVLYADAIVTYAVLHMVLAFPRIDGQILSTDPDLRRLIPLKEWIKSNSRSRPHGLPSPRDLWRASKEGYSRQSYIREVLESWKDEHPSNSILSSLRKLLTVPIFCNVTLQNTMRRRMGRGGEPARGVFCGRAFISWAKGPSENIETFLGFAAWSRAGVIHDVPFVDSWPCSCHVCSPRRSLKEIEAEERERERLYRLATCIAKEPAAPGKEVDLPNEAGPTPQMCPRANPSLPVVQFDGDTLIFPNVECFYSVHQREFPVFGVDPGRRMVSPERRSASRVVLLLRETDRHPPMAFYLYHVIFYADQFEFQWVCCPGRSNKYQNVRLNYGREMHFIIQDHPGDSDELRTIYTFAFRNPFLIKGIVELAQHLESPRPEDQNRKKIVKLKSDFCYRNRNNDFINQEVPETAARHHPFNPEGRRLLLGSHYSSLLRRNPEVSLPEARSAFLVWPTTAVPVPHMEWREVHGLRDPYYAQFAEVAEWHRKKMVNWNFPVLTKQEGGMLEIFNPRFMENVILYDTPYDSTKMVEEEMDYPGGVRVAIRPEVGEEAADYDAALARFLYFTDKVPHLKSDIATLLTIMAKSRVGAPGGADGVFVLPRPDYDYYYSEKPRPKHERNPDEVEDEEPLFKIRPLPTHRSEFPDYNGYLYKQIKMKRHRDS